MQFLPQLMQYVWHGLKPCVELEVLSVVHFVKKIGLKLEWMCLQESRLLWFSTWKKLFDFFIGYFRPQHE